MKILQSLGFFLAGCIVTGAAVHFLGVGRNHAREETKMAFINRETAIKRGDRAMQTYFEEVITWNACTHLDLRFFEGKNAYKIDWLAKEVDEPIYRRIKDGISYADLRKLKRERDDRAQ
jgi:hypothetical protein